MNYRDVIARGLRAPADWSDGEIYARGLMDGVERFWEPGYDYDSADFWYSYDGVTEDFIRAVRSYDKTRDGSL